MYATDYTVQPAGTGASPQRRSFYRPEIDGLRAIAVIAVIINHFNPDLISRGFLGVDIFFVISGFVVTSSLVLYCFSYFAGSLRL